MKNYLFWFLLNVPIIGYSCIREETKQAIQPFLTAQKQEHFSKSHAHLLESSQALHKHDIKLISISYTSRWKFRKSEPLFFHSRWSQFQGHLYPAIPHNTQLKHASLAHM